MVSRLIVSDCKRAGSLWCDIFLDATKNPLTTIEGSAKLKIDYKFNLVFPQITDLQDRFFVALIPNTF